MEQLSIPIFLTGLGIAVLGLLLLVVAAFRDRFLWGMACLLGLLGLTALGVLVLIESLPHQQPTRGGASLLGLPLTWGVPGLLGLPLLAFLVIHWRRARLPLAVLVLGLVVGASPAVYSRLVPIDLGPREKLVDGELHITLTGWDQKDYSVLRARSDVVILQMANADVTDDTLQYLKGMEKLRELDLNNRRTRCTDHSLPSCSPLPPRGLPVSVLAGRASCRCCFRMTSRRGPAPGSRPTRRRGR